MKYQIVKIHSGNLIEDEQKLNFFQLCSLSRLTPNVIIELINEGIIQPEGVCRSKWRFSYDSLSRIDKLIRLQRDFELDHNSSALVIGLIDKIEKLESILKNSNSEIRL